MTPGPLFDDSDGVLSDSAANAVVKRVLDCRAYRDRVTAWAEHEVRLINAKEDWTIQANTPRLTRYVEEKLRTSLLRKRTVNLPAGRIGFRVSPAKLVVRQQDTVLAECRRLLPAAINLTVSATGAAAMRLAEFAATLPGVEVKTSVRVAELRHHFQATGEFMRGTALESATESLAIQTA